MIELITEPHVKLNKCTFLAMAAINNLDKHQKGEKNVSWKEIQDLSMIIAVKFCENSDPTILLTLDESLIITKALADTLQVREKVINGKLFLNTIVQITNELTIMGVTQEIPSQETYVRVRTFLSYLINHIARYEQNYQ